MARTHASALASATVPAAAAAWRRPHVAAESTPRVLIVVPTLNEVGHVEELVEQLLGDREADGHRLLVVVDGGSTDGTREAVARLALRHPSVRLLHNPARVQSAAVNLAVRRFGHDADVLIRCDAHAGYPPSFCERLVETLRRADADAVVVVLDSVGHTPLQRAVAWVSNTIVGTGGAAHRGGRRSGFVDHGHHAAFRVEAFCRSGGYDETFSHNEDAELDCRQRTLGAKVYLNADLRVAYHPRSTWSGLTRQYFQYGRGRARTFRRHPASIRLRQLAVPTNFVGCLLCVAASPVAPLLLAWPLLYTLALLATSIALSIRHESRDGLLSGPAAAVMHCSWACGLLRGLVASRDRAWHPQMAAPLVLSNAEDVP